MPYIKSINKNPGDSVDDCIKTYLTLKSTGLTDGRTVMNINDIEYPIGHFSEENMNSFKLGLITLGNLSAFAGYGNLPSDPEYKKHATYFADQIIEQFHDDPYTAEDIINEFDSLMHKITRKKLDDAGIPMLDEEDKQIIAEKIAQRKAEMGRTF